MRLLLAKSLENIILVGFMGAGKSVVGKALSARLGYPMVDTDLIIEQRAGMPIPEIFRRYGEAYFRNLEEEVVAEVAAKRGQIIATGGGVLLREANRSRLRASGILVYLKAHPLAIIERLRGAGLLARPLLAGGESQDEQQLLSRITEMLTEREPLYAQADVTLETSDRTIEEVVEEIIDLVTKRRIREVSVSLGARSYRIVIGFGILDQLGPRIISTLGADGVSPNALIVTNPDVDSLWGQSVRQSLHAAGFNVHTAIVPAGEEYKSLAMAGQLYDHCVLAGLDRKSPVIALGGGVIGDLAGFVAATYLRGLPFVQVPTTLLAQVDSSIGGKVAVNHPRAKNLIGAFHQPSLVLADVHTLSTLPRREFCAGMAEVIKHGVIASAEYFDFIEQNTAQIMGQDPAALVQLIAGSCSIKGKVVEMDERESRHRMILNFGHTVGHAVEAATGYGRFLHGEAVAIGMVAAARLGSLYFEGSGVAQDPDLLPRLEHILHAFNLPVRIPALPLDSLLSAMAMDKKAIAGAINWVLPVRAGEVRIIRGVDPALVRRVLLDLGAQEG